MSVCVGGCVGGGVRVCGCLCLACVRDVKWTKKRERTAKSMLNKTKMFLKNILARQPKLFIKLIASWFDYFISKVLVMLNVTYVGK